jgi:septal ring factor EnvC (AmiA/AmiB activator)
MIADRFATLTRAFTSTTAAVLRPLPVLGTLILAIAVTLGVLPATPALAQAQATSPAGKEAWEQTREKITGMRAQARQMRADALQAYSVAEQKCLKKFLASDCLNDARKSRVEVERQAAAIEREAQSIERQIKAEKHAAEIARNEEKAQRDATDATRRAEETRIKAEKNATHRAKQLAKTHPCPCDCPPAR